MLGWSKLNKFAALQSYQNNIYLIRVRNPTLLDLQDQGVHVVALLPQVLLHRLRSPNGRILTGQEV